MTGTRKPRGRTACFLSAACAVLWVGAFAATHTPVDRLPQDLPHDRLLHFMGYLVLSAMLLVTLACRGVPGPRRVALGLCAMAFYAAFDEITQSLVARQPAFMDWLTDVGGAIAGTALAETARLVVGKHVRRRKSE